MLSDALTWTGHDAMRATKLCCRQSPILESGIPGTGIPVSIFRIKPQIAENVASAMLNKSNTKKMETILEATPVLAINRQIELLFACIFCSCFSQKVNFFNLFPMSEISIVCQLANKVQKDPKLGLSPGSTFAG